MSERDSPARPSATHAEQDAVRRGLWAVIAAFVAIALLYSIVVPPFETPDEIWHYAFIQHVASGNGLPISEANTQALWQQQARRQRMIQEQREKFAELNKQVRELQQKLYPVRNRLMAQDAEVKELAAKLEQVLEAKMVKAAPELAEVIKQRNELQEQMRQLMRPRPAE